MPYVKPEQRRDWHRYHPANPGELNFALTERIIAYVEEHGLSYQSINDVVGALESVKAEFQRRVVAPYEDTKLKENGDVYPEALLSRRPDDGHSAV